MLAVRSRSLKERSANAIVTPLVSVDAKALAETKGVTIAFADRSFNERLRTASILDVRAEGATLHVPLDKSSLALDRLESCFEKNGREGIDANPFVAPSRKP